MTGLLMSNDGLKGFLKMLDTTLDLATLVPYSGLLLWVQIVATLKQSPPAEISAIAKSVRQENFLFTWNYKNFSLSSKNFCETCFYSQISQKFGPRGKTCYKVSPL